MAAADIVAIPSMYEGHANTPIEAMAAGRPIVASAVDGVKESFCDGVEGFLVAPADINHMSGRILELLSDPELRSRMGEAGGARVKAYEKGSVMKRYLLLLFELLKITPATGK